MTARREGERVAAVLLDRASFRYVDESEREAKEASAVPASPSAPGEGVRDVSLSVAPGRCLVLCGRSGEGKSTVLRMIDGLAGTFFPGDLSGVVEVCGADVRRLAPRERAERLGVVMQDPRSQFFMGTVGDEIAFTAENLGVDPAEVARRVRAAAEVCGVEGLMGEGLSALSSGQKQRVALAAAVACEPAVLVLDEPTSNLDAEGSAALVEVLARLKARGAAVVVSEHRLHRFLDVADEYLYLRSGRVIARWSPAELAALPLEEVQALGLRQEGPFGGASAHRGAGETPGPAARSVVSEEGEAASGEAAAAVEAGGGDARGKGALANQGAFLSSGGAAENHAHPSLSSASGEAAGGAASSHGVGRLAGQASCPAAPKIKEEGALSSFEGAGERRAGASLSSASGEAAGGAASSHGVGRLAGQASCPAAPKIKEEGALSSFEGAAERRAGASLSSASDGGAGSARVWRVEGLTYLHPSTKRGVRGLDADFPCGAVTVVAGPNGVGKTTLAKVLCGAVREQTGCVTFCGRPVARRERRRRGYFVMQDADYQLYAGSVADEVVLGRRVDDALKARAWEALEAFDLADLADRHPASLSGGQKQRVTLAAAYCSDADLVVLDEPTSGLDGRGVVQVAAWCRRLARAGKTVVVVTHDELLARMAGDRRIDLR